MNRASTTETVDLGSNPGRVKPKIIKLGFIAFLFEVWHEKRHCEASTLRGKQVGRGQLDSKTAKARSLPPGQCNLKNKDIILIVVLNKALLSYSEKCWRF